LGFGQHNDAEVLAQVAREAPHLLAACSSASSMWAANAATLSPAHDTADGRLHITPANLLSQPHRAIEPATTANILRAIFANETHFAHHPPLLGSVHFADEGAANHTRLARHHGSPGVELFVYGRDPFNPSDPVPTRYPARQSHAASQAIARLHGLEPHRVVFLQQNPAAIDAGVFHNDLIAVGNANVLLYHERAFADESDAMVHISRAWLALHHRAPLITVRITDEQLPLDEAVSTYLFNSQLLSRPEGQMMLLCPAECQASDMARATLESIRDTDDNPIRDVQYVDVRESMRNGGGPACLRLRVVLTEPQQAAVSPGVWLTDELADALDDWIDRHYRDELRPADLADPALLRESRQALDRLTQLLDIGSVYDFQR
jgi:succinylarginine dihydrolase